MRRPHETAYGPLAVGSDERPLADHLPAEMGEDALREAVERTDLALKVTIADLLRKGRFWVEEDWTWADPRTGAERALDLVAASGGEWHDSDAGSVRLVCCLPTECRQSQGPYLGLPAATPPPLNFHPPMTQQYRIDLYSDDNKRYRSVNTLDLLGLKSHPYLTEPPVMYSLCHARLHDDRIEVTSEDTVSSLLHPLAQGSRRYREYWQAIEMGRDKAHVVRLIFPLVVVSAPLLALHGGESSSEFEPVPWMRVLRRQTVGGSDAQDRLGVGLDAIDVITAEYLRTYVNEHLAPFVEAFSAAFAQIQDFALEGCATLPGLKKGEPLPEDARDRLRPSNAHSHP